jgi:hypothetical protein
MVPFSGYFFFTAFFVAAFFTVFFMPQPQPFLAHAIVPHLLSP